MTFASALPADFSVNWNQTTAKPNTVNTTLNYTCGRKCKSFYTIDIYVCYIYLWSMHESNAIMAFFHILEQVA
jgi:hypothetical protein